jgi:hypothetical protein
LLEANNKKTDKARWADYFDHLLKTLVALRRHQKDCVKEKQSTRETNMTSTVTVRIIEILVAL